MRSFLQRVALGIRRHPIRIIVESGVAFAAFWAVLDPIQSMLAIQMTGWSRFLSLVATAFIAGVLRATPVDSGSAPIAGSTTRLSISYRDLFDERGVIAVPVNEYFDSALGPHVSPKSLHGQLITHIFGGDSAHFDAAVDANLTSQPLEQINRPSGRSRRFAVGTTAFLPTGRPSVLAFVLAHTDRDTLKASADVPQMWSALSGLWQAARIHCNETPLALPIVGGGLSGVGLSAQHLLSLIVMSASHETHRQRICADIHICISPHLRAETSIEAALQLLS